MKPVSLRKLAETIDGRLLGDPDVPIHGVAGIKEARPGEITFLANARYASLLPETRASAVILSKPHPDVPCAQVIVEDPYYAFARVVSVLVEPPGRAIGVSPLAAIGKAVRLGRDLSIHPFVTLGDRAVIGDRVVLYPGVFIGEETEIGDDTVIHANVSVREKVIIGRRVIIHSGTVIGSDGFGFATHKGRHHKIPQIGTVVIEDDVEIGANVAVDRAAMGRTMIRRGTKIDNLVQIAHNVTVGEDCLLVSQVGISGSTVIGHHVTLAGQTGVAGHLTVGDNVVAGGRTGVTKDVASNQVVSGYPALPHREWLAAQATFPQLPELRKRIKELETKLERLEKQRGGEPPERSGR
ncbi:MAG TPA: UDP-3-O-(3-hydroxymyristoyl)glucosamine N-acyltransferase [Nitrospiria bacterium]|jgi:UDP-3-O-[3-hydroxymyristoyl] glucosamine N-acyltransferase|nr:UDP-3-O-(3-hydroxymyristoyl)glucosamine N-acyltransferase [Nitrospiria bacterium]